jgi:hypothetical protein
MGQMGGGVSPAAPSAKKIGAKRFEQLNVPDPIASLLTGLFLRDVNDFFFDDERRERMKQALRNRHDRPAWRCPLDVAQFITIGSPLGLGEVRDQLRRINRLSQGKLPTPASVRQWTNVFDPHDIVAQNLRLSAFYAGAVVPVDHALDNPDGRRDAHSATGYLRLSAVRAAVREHVEKPARSRLPASI